MASYSTVDDAAEFLRNAGIDWADTLNGSDAEYVSLANEATRIIRGQLSGILSAGTLATWAGASTPETIRGIAGRLVAALAIRPRVGADGVASKDNYGQTLYNEAMDMLTMIRNGDMVIDGIDPSGGDHITSNSYFYPNDSTIGQPDDVKITMGADF